MFCLPVSGSLLLVILVSVAFFSLVIFAPTLDGEVFSGASEHTNITGHEQLYREGGVFVYHRGLPLGPPG